MKPGVWLAVIALSAAVPANASDRQLTTIWLVQADQALLGERDLAREDYVFKQRLLPTALIELAPAQSAALPDGLTSGMQLVEVTSKGASVYCDANIRSQKLIGHAQPCLVDADMNGEFEGMFLTTSVTKGLLTIQGNRPKKPKAIPPVAYRKIPPEQFAEKLFVGIQYRGNANPAGNHVFQVNYGDEAKTGSLTERYVVSKAEIGSGLKQWFGGAFTIVAETPAGIRVKVDKTMPVRPFGVVQTTTYTIY